ncbi:MATE family efflux transporter [Helcococcus bovis]|uniref:MATE family efflux transporter n=1 Tax=Helcococcus bovis TaxID=3153252 RepID=UPI0038BB8D89
MKNISNDLGKGNVLNLFFKLSTPAIIAQLVNMLYNMVDRIYIGRLPEIGSIALSGIGVANPIIMLISSFAALIGIGGSPLASIALGANDKEKATNILNVSASISIIIAITLSIFIFIFLEPLLNLIGASENNIEYSLVYSRIYILGSIAVMFSFGMNFFMAVQGFAKEAMFTTLLGAILNIILDPIFIFLFDLKVAGAAIATIIAQIVSAIWVIKFLCSDKSFIKLNFKKFSLNWKILTPILALGFSPFVMQSTESLLQIAFNRSLFKYGGDLYVSTMSINFMVMQIIFLPLSGLSSGGVALLSYNYGARNFKRIKETLKVLISSSFIYGTILTSLIFIFPEIFVKLFTNDKKLIDATIPMMKVFIAGSFLMAVQTALQQAFVAFGQAKRSTFNALLRKIILLIPLIYILPQFIGDKIFAVYVSEPIADIIAAVVTCINFYLYFKEESKKI